MSQHDKFIRTPISQILDDAEAALSGMSPDIDSIGMCEYFMQSVFLKMTGFQEQKMKCICWELATVDYEYRYERYSQSPLGECSNYAEKCAVYHDIISRLKRLKRLDAYKTKLAELKLRNKIMTELEKLHSSLSRLGWLERDYVNCKDFLDRKDCCFVDLNTAKFFGCCENCSEKPNPKTKDKTKVAKCLKRSINEAYRQVVYNHRNRCAHNTLSYQVDSPRLQTMASPSAQYENYYVRFALLLGIDLVIVEAYKQWLDAIAWDASI